MTVSGPGISSYGLCLIPGVVVHDSNAGTESVPRSDTCGTSPPFRG